MKFNVSSNDLNQGLSAVIGAVPSKATLPILETILFESEDSRIKITATDLEIYITEYIEADIEEEGSVAIPARRLLETLRQLPNIQVFFEVDSSHNVEFKTDKGKYKLVGEEADDFPKVPDMQSGTILNTETELIQKAVNKTMFAVSSDDLRPAMMGVYFDIGAGDSTFVATDGHRLVRYKNSDFKSDKPLSFIVPDKALNLVSKSLDGDDCELTVSAEHARFSSGNTTVITRLINEQYPNYESVIPRDNEKVLLVDKAQILSTVRRVSVFSSSTTRQIRLLLQKDKLTIRAEDLDMSSEAKETISCDYNSDEMEIGFNARYLADVLSNVDGDEARFEFSSPNRAGIVKPAGEKEHETMLMLVMPVMLNSYGA
ncbi:MAG: DNA polymerase III subunit beta [Balneolaceae bacterium]|nr:MAG: DNA polymerase III subunit beta [Balneolaceae bacterium]